MTYVSAILSVCTTCPWNTKKINEFSLHLCKMNNSDNWPVQVTCLYTNLRDRKSSGNRYMLGSSHELIRYKTIRLKCYAKIS